LTSLVEGLRHRKLVQWSLAYLAAAWVVLEALAFASDTFGWPQAILRSVTVLALFGLAAVLVVSWFHGESGDQRVGAREVALLGALAVGAAVGVGWAVRPPEAPAAAGALAPLSPSSVAVLPFVDLSGDPSEAYFSDGITEEILNALAQVPGLRVAARTSSFAWKDREADVREVGRSLSVGRVLEGSVRRDGDRIRITAQLIDVENGYHMWSRTFERASTDIFAVQDEIARAVANALELRLMPDADGARRPTDDPLALDLYLRARHAWNERTLASLREAESLFGQAIERDAGYALAYAGLADVHGLLEDYGGVPGEEAFPAAIDAAQQALEIDEGLAEAHAAMGHVLMHLARWGEADAAYGRALQLNPNLAQARHWYSIMLSWLGRHDEALRENALARRLDPMSLRYREAGGMYLFYARRPGDAITAQERLLAEHPDRPLAQFILGLALGETGRHEEAVAAMARAAEVAGDERWRTHEARALARAGRTEEARALLERLERTWPNDPAVTPYIPEILVLLGERDAALTRLLDIVAAGDGDMATLNVDPVMDPVRSDPRFREVLRRINIPGA